MKNWHSVIKDTFTSWEYLADFLELSSEQRQEIQPKSNFPLKLPRRLAEKIEMGNLEDPILKQFLPHRQELNSNGYLKDPLEEREMMITPRLLHKYQRRMLIVSTGVCAMHCRYCFRRNFPYEANRSDFTAEIAAIQDDPSIIEVILSGGDPLSLSDERLLTLIEKLNEIPHLKHLRFHTRFPIGIPERIDDAFLKVLERWKGQCWFVIHCNHPRELDEDHAHVFAQLKKLGVTLLNQTVLLKGVNDTVEVLEQLSLKLLEMGVLPYYLHALDPVEGASHFAVSDEKGLQLAEALRALLPGYGVPLFVREIPGKSSKTPIED